MKIRGNVDLLAGLGSGAWAVAAVFVGELGGIVSTEAAAAFAVVALGRWYNDARKAARGGDVDR